MGYVHDTQFSQFMGPSDFSFTAGTWTQTIASNVHKTVRTANASAFTFSLPIKIPANAAGLKGCYLKSIDFWYKIATADLTDFASLGLDKMTMTADAVAPTGAAVTVTLDAAHDTAAERKAQQDGKATITLSTPVWIGANDVFVLTGVLDCAASSVVTIYGARANFTLRE